MTIKVKERPEGQVVTVSVKGRPEGHDTFIKGEARRPSSGWMKGRGQKVQDKRPEGPVQGG